MQDEFDEEEEIDIKEIEENKYEANAMLRLDELAEFFQLDEDSIDDEDIDTVGGLVVKLLGRLAEVNDTVTFDDLTFIVKEIDGARITKLEIIKKAKEQADEEVKN